MLSPQSPIHLERTPPVWSPTAAGFFRFDIIHIRKGSPHEGFVDVWQEAQSQGFEPEEEGDGDEENRRAQEEQPGLMASSVKAAFVVSRKPQKKKKLGSGRAAKPARRPSNLGRGK